MAFNSCMRAWSVFQIARLHLLQNKSCGLGKFCQETSRRQQTAGSFLNICHCRILRNWGPIDSQPWLIFLGSPALFCCISQIFPHTKKYCSPDPGSMGQDAGLPLIRPIGYFLSADGDARPHPTVPPLQFGSSLQRGGLIEAFDGH